MRTIILSSIILINFLFAQNYNLRFDKLSSKDGLSQNTVSSILQDSKGYMWFGTQSGLNRYDGYSFKVYSDLTNKNNPYDSKNITSMKEDINGNIWIGTATDGITVYNSHTARFSKIPPVDEASISINEIYIDSRQNVWIATENSGLQKYDLNFNHKKTYKFNPDDENSLSSNRVSCLFEDRQGILWIGTADAGLNRLDISGETIKRIKLIDNHINITAMNQDINGILWIGTVLNGIILFDPQTNNKVFYNTDSDNNNSLAHNSIRTIFKDSQDRFWIGTDGGLTLYVSQKNTFYNFYNDPQNPASLSSNQIISIYEDQSGIIWMGSYNSGINRFSNNNKIFTNYHQNPNRDNALNSNEIWSVYEQNPGYIWIGSDKGLSLWNKSKDTFTHYEANTYKGSLNYNIVRTIYPFNENELLIGTNGGGLNIFNISTGKCEYFTYKNEPGYISDNFVRAIEKSEDGNYWIATMGGLNLFMPSTKSFKVYKNIAGDSTSICDNRILDIYIDYKERLWLATYNGLSLLKDDGTFLNFQYDQQDTATISNNLVVSLYQSENDRNTLWIGTLSGLNKLDLNSFKITRFQQKEQNISNVIYSILEDQQNNLWMGTNKGLLRFNKKNHSFKNFGINDGILNDEFNAGSGCRLTDNSLLFGGVSGMTGFSPSEISKNKHIPNIVITSCKIYEKEISVDSLQAANHTLELTYNDKFISFEFAALDYMSAGKNAYKYMLEGFDKDWNNADHRRYASYTNLDGGDYIFKVIGSNNDGVWNDKPTSLKILVKPPFWKTIWFRVLGALLFLLAGLAFYHNRITRIDSQRKELQVKVSERTKELYRRNLELLKTQKEKDRILLNVEEGFFLINKDYTIQSQHSAALLEILKIDKVAGKSLFTIIAEYLPEKTCNMAQEYIDLLFDNSLDEELIADLNPMDQLEFNFKNRETGIFSKFLTFKAKRILNDEQQIEGLIITVIDETEEHLLSVQLRETESRSKKQIEWVMGILHIESSLLYEFMNSTASEMENMHIWLKSDPESYNEYVMILENIARSLHLIKGNANLLDLKFFAQHVHDVEEKVIEIKNKNDLSGSDFLPVVMQLNDLKNTLNELSQLMDRLASLNTSDKLNRKTNDENESGFMNSVKSLIKRMALDLNKTVELDYSSFRFGLVPPQYKMLVKNIITQLIRNSMTHGIETTEERTASGKNIPAKISITNDAEANTFKMHFYDDGRGLQLQKLREKAIESEKWNKDEIISWDRETLAEVIFEPGISSASSSDLFAGRGIGMDLIRSELEKHDGKIEVDFKETEYCQFIITLPLISEN
ncbi:MAG: hypothetical protein KDF60_14145 [Calditrichaeota bacterium]|nr:hypothetical protein [Calditrichota bacterium]